MFLHGATTSWPTETRTETQNIRYFHMIRRFPTTIISRPFLAYLQPFGKKPGFFKVLIRKRTTRHKSRFFDALEKENLSGARYAQSLFGRFEIRNSRASDVWRPIPEPVFRSKWFVFARRDEGTGEGDQSSLRVEFTTRPFPTFPTLGYFLLSLFFFYFPFSYIYTQTAVSSSGFRYQ